MTLSTILAIWAAILSTLLGGLKIWELWGRRLHLTISYSFAGADDGNQVIIENPTNMPVMVSYWELLTMRHACWRRKIVSGRFPDEGYCNITIAPHSRHVLVFRDGDYFRWPFPEDTSLYLKLHIVGRRKPVELLVYNARRDS